MKGQTYSIECSNNQSDAFTTRWIIVMRIEQTTAR